MSRSRSTRAVLMVRLDQVVPATRNAKRHSTAIEGSIERFGFADPLIRDDRIGRLVAGHGRHEALIRLARAGKKPPDGVVVDQSGSWLVLVLTGWSSRTDAEAEAFLIAHNQTSISGGWDEEVLKAAMLELDEALPDFAACPLGFDERELARLLADQDIASPPDAAQSGPVDSDYDDLNDHDGSDGASVRRPDDMPAENPPTVTVLPAPPQTIDGLEDENPNDALPESECPPPPFPWFGGKRRVAGLVWQALGDVDNYVEPFAGSLAVLLGRPAAHQGTCTTVNDLDSFICNFRRSLKAAPDEVAQYADHPVVETDLFARHAWLVNTGRERIAALEADPDHYDAKVAGWWVWGQCCWIGSGWCSGKGPHRPGAGAAGVASQRPHLGNEGQGVAYMRDLAAHVGDVRVCCGDWTRVVTRGALTYGTTVGVFLDPPYLEGVCDAGLYSQDDSKTLANDVREWALSATIDDPRLRVVLAGYEPEHETHMPASWRRVKWRANRAYGTAANADSGNRDLERLWLSPSSLPVGNRLPS